ncbi:MAG: hypothetical protein KC591_14500 [Gemmatimonadetes bacterium]|nr:hypothetical protein [Gemmatimonadota bacterium]
MLTPSRRRASERSHVPVIAAALVVLLPGGTLAHDVCFEPTQGADLNASLDCDGISAKMHDNAWIGISETGTPCQEDPWCGDGPCRAYRWTFSLRDDDPLANTGPIPPDHKIYLWLESNRDLPPQATQFRVQSSVRAIAFQPLNGVQSLAGEDLPDLVLEIPFCPRAPMLAGILTLDVIQPVEAETWGRVKSYYHE